MPGRVLPAGDSYTAPAPTLSAPVPRTGSLGDAGAESTFAWAAAPLNQVGSVCQPLLLLRFVAGCSLAKWVPAGRQRRRSPPLPLEHIAECGRRDTDDATFWSKLRGVYPIACMRASNTQPKHTYDKLPTPICFRYCHYLHRSPPQPPPALLGCQAPSAPKGAPPRQLQQTNQAVAWQQRLPHTWASLRQAPQAVAEQLAALCNAGPNCQASPATAAGSRQRDGHMPRYVAASRLALSSTSPASASSAPCLSRCLLASLLCRLLFGTSLRAGVSGGSRTLTDWFNGGPAPHAGVSTRSRPHQTLRLTQCCSSRKLLVQLAY